MPGCRLLLPPSLRHSNRTDSATNTAASWPPANKDSFRALLNSTAELGAHISFVKQSVQSGQEFFSSFAPCPAHRLGLTSSSAYTYLYYTTPTVFGSFFCAVFPKIDIWMFTCQKTAFYATDVYHTAYDVYWWHQIKKKGGTFMKPVWAIIVGLFTDYG